MQTAKTFIALSLALAAVSCSRSLEISPETDGWEGFVTKADAPEDNNPPTVSTDYEGSFVVHAHETIVMDIYVSDPEGDPFVVSFDGGSSAATNKKIDEGHYQMTLKGANAQPGIYAANYVAMDVYGAANEFTIGYEISSNHAPEVVKPVESYLFETIGGSFSIDLTDHIQDPDGEKLSFEATMTTRGLVDMKLSGSVLTGKTYNYGRTDIVVTASDAAGLQAILQFAVLCREKDSGVSVYPNPVVPNTNGQFLLYVCGGQEEMTDIKLYTAGGSLAWSGTLEASVFTPAIIDMTSFASGKYDVVVTISGQTFTKSIIKL